MHIPKVMKVVRFEIFLLEILVVKTALPTYPCRCKCSRMSENRVTYVFYALTKQRVLFCLIRILAARFSLILSCTISLFICFILLSPFPQALKIFCACLIIPVLEWNGAFCVDCMIYMSKLYTNRTSKGGY